MRVLNVGAVLLSIPMLLLLACGGGDAEMHYDDAQKLIDQDQLELAIAVLDEAIRLDPGYADAYNRRGVARISAGEPQGAIEDFTAAIILNLELDDAYRNRGAAYLNLGYSELAIENLNEAIRLNPCRSGPLTAGDYPTSTWARLNRLSTTSIMRSALILSSSMRTTTGDSLTPAWAMSSEPPKIMTKPSG